MGKYHVVIFWAYASEVILSSAVLILSILVWGPSQVSAFVVATASDFASYFGATMLAASFALFWTFYSKSDSRFMQWLQERGAFQTYILAFRSAIAIYVFMLFMVFLTNNVENSGVVLLTAWVSLLGIVNAYSLVKNISDLMKLNVLFNNKNESP